MNSLLTSARPSFARSSEPQASISHADVYTLFVLGVLYGLVSTFKDTAPSGGIEPLAIARSLAASGRFADPFGVATGPTAHMAPLFPAYLAAVLRIFQSGAMQILALRVCAAVFHGLTIALLPALSEVVIASAEAGFVAGLLSFVIPCYHVLTFWDSSLSGLAVIAFCIAAARFDPHSPRHMLTLGALAGLILLLNPVLAIPIATWSVYASRTRRWPLQRSALALAAAILVCVPWTVRNYVTLGGLAPIRDNFGLELQISNNDAAVPAIRHNLASLEQFHPSINRAQAEEVRRAGELAYNRDKLRQALSWILANPGRFAGLTIRRVRDFWLPGADAGLIFAAATWIVTLLSLPGMWIAISRRLPYARALLAMLLLAPLPFYVIQSDARYRTPLLWVTFLFAGYALHTMMRFGRPQVGSS